MENILTWVAPVATIIAALMTASNLGSRITGAGFIVFTVGSLAWLSLGMMRDDQALLWMNVVLTSFNLFGIWRWLGRQAKFEDGGKHAAEESQTKPTETLFPVSLAAKAAVTGSDGAELGKAVDAMAGCSNGRIAYFVVTDGGVGGVGETLRRLDWKDAVVDGETISASIDGAAFRRLDVIEKDRWPAR